HERGGDGFTRDVVGVVAFPQSGGAVDRWVQGDVRLAILDRLDPGGLFRYEPDGDLLEGGRAVPVLLVGSHPQRSVVELLDLVRTRVDSRPDQFGGILTGLAVFAIARHIVDGHHCFVRQQVRYVRCRLLGGQRDLASAGYLGRSTGQRGGEVLVAVQ